jgi:hypothetical protein
MSREQRSELADRKALLATKASLDRVRLALAWHDLRAQIGPVRTGKEGSSGRPFIAKLIAVAAPIIGIARMRRALRLASIAVFVFRVARAWRR